MEEEETPQNCRWKDKDEGDEAEVEEEEVEYDEDEENPAKGAGGETNGIPTKELSNRLTAPGEVEAGPARNTTGLAPKSMSKARGKELWEAIRALRASSERNPNSTNLFT